MKNIRLYLFAILVGLVWGGIFEDVAHASNNIYTGYVPIEKAQKILMFYGNKYSISVKGDIMLCLRYIKDRHGKCGENNDGWEELSKHVIPGYKIAGINFTGYYNDTTLIVFYSKE